MEEEYRVATFDCKCPECNSKHEVKIDIVRDEYIAELKKQARNFKIRSSMESSDVKRLGLIFSIQAEVKE